MSDDSHITIRTLVIEYADSGLDHGQIYEKLEANHPDAVDGYVATQRRALLVQAIRMIVGSTRRQRAHRARFAVAVDKIAAGENVLRSLHAGKSLVEMTKRDLLDFAADEEQAGNSRLSNARLARALARKVPKDKTVGDVFTPEQITDLYRRFGLGVAA